jgi:hypothetical protein
MLGKLRLEWWATRLLSRYLRLCKGFSVAVALSRAAGDRSDQASTRTSDQTWHILSTLGSKLSPSGQAMPSRLQKYENVTGV